jgi:hypothetical protein
VAATATPIIDPVSGAITGFAGFTAGSGYTNTSPITVTFSAPGVGGTKANAMVTTTGLPVINKAIQELFDPVYGRMNATLAVELPFSTATVATTIPLAYIDTPIEYLDAIKDGETQIWKVTHNGVDSHPVHFHLVNVQVINRVGWDGTVKPPAANEVGWKETLRMNPLEDVYVAVKATRPVVPFGVPASQRVLDPSQAVGSSLGFTQIDPLTGAAPSYQTQLVAGVTSNVVTAKYTNQLTDFDNEYVWHCHILGHEEQDFMRPFIFRPSVVVPDAPASVVVGTNVTWVDTTPVGGQDAQGIPTAGTNAANPTPTNSPKNEIGFKIYVNAVLDATGHVPAATVPVALVPANVTSWPTPAGATTANTLVVAYNAAGDSLPGSGATTTTAVAAPTTLAGAKVSGTTVTVASTAGLTVGMYVSGGGFATGTTITAITSATTFTTSAAGTTTAAGVTVSLAVSTIAPALPVATPGTIAVTGTLDATGKVVTVASATGLVVGATVSGGGFPMGTTIAAIKATAPFTFTTSLASTAACATAPTTLCVPVILTVSQVAAAATPTPAASVAPGGFTQTLNSTGTTTLAWTPVPGALSYTVSITETPAVVAPALPVPLPAVIATILPVTTSLTATIDATGNTVLVTSVVPATGLGVYVGGTVTGGGYPAGTVITSINAVANTFTTSAPSKTPNALAQVLSVTSVPPTYTTPAALIAGSTYAFSVTATTLSGTTVAATAGLTNSQTLPPVAFSGVADAAGSASITLSWANNALNSNNVAGLLLTCTPAAGAAVSKAFAANTTGATVNGLTAGASYSFTLQATSNVTAFNSTVVSLPAAIVAP